jgi:hypothetical protein
MNRVYRDFRFDGDSLLANPYRPVPDTVSASRILQFFNRVIVLGRLRCRLRAKYLFHDYEILRNRTSFGWY